MRTTLEIAFYCRASKATKKGVAPIEISISLNGTRKFLNLPLKVNPSDFNKKHKPQYIEDYLSSQRTLVNNAVVDLAKNNLPLTINALKEYIQSGGVKSYTIKDWQTDFFKMLGKKLKSEMSLPHYKRYEYVQGIIYQYLKEDDELTQITPLLMDEIYTDLKAKYELSTACGYMTKIKRMVKFAIDNGKLTINPFQSIKIKKGEKQIEFLTAPEIDKLEALHMVLTNKTLIGVLDVFLFSCYSGLAYIDMKELQPNDIRYKEGYAYIEKKRHKTGTTFTSVLFPQALSILQRYDYHLPVITNQKTNEYLKQLGAMAQIDTNLHCHLGRATYACQLLNSGVRMETVARALGHKKMDITAKHYAKLLNTTVIQEITEAI